MCRHLDRANTFWLAFILTDDLTAQRVLREWVRANRRLRAQPLVILQPGTPDELTDLLDELEARGAPLPGCTWVRGYPASRRRVVGRLARFPALDEPRRDVLRARLGGLVIATPSAVKTVAQRESPDLWSVQDLLIELAPRPVAARSAMPVAELAGPARERVSRAVHRAAARSENQLAAVLLLAQSDGYRAAGDTAGALHLVQEGLTLGGIELRTREGLLDSGVQLASAVSELDLALQYAAESVALTEWRVSADGPGTERDFSIGLGQLGDVTRDLGDLTAAHTHHQEALDIDRRLAEQLGTPQALRDLRAGLTDLAKTEEKLGNTERAAALRAESAAVSDQLAALATAPQISPASDSYDWPHGTGIALL